MIGRVFHTFLDLPDLHKGREIQDELNPGNMLTELLCHFQEYGNGLLHMEQAAAWKEAHREALRIEPPGLERIAFPGAGFYPVGHQVAYDFNLVFLNSLHDEVLPGVLILDE